MKLSIGNLYVRDVLLGDADAFADGVLTINKKAAIDYLMGEDDHITSLDIVIARPGDDTRIVPVIETIEPRCRMDGRTLFPGVTGEVSPAGDGELKAFKGCCVTVVGGTYGSFGDGVIDMGGEGAKHTYWSKLINICLVGETDEDFERFEQQKCNHALRWAGHRFAEYIGKIAKDLEPEDTETYIFDPILRRSEERKNLPNVAIVLQPQSQMEALAWKLGHVQGMLRKAEKPVPPDPGIGENELVVPDVLILGDAELSRKAAVVQHRRVEEQTGDQLGPEPG